MAYGDFAKIYDELIYEDINYEEMCSRILDICNSEGISFENYLDIACGTGNVTIRLAKNFKEVFAVDLSEDMLQEAFEKFKKEKIRCKIICQDMSELCLNRKFDLITSVLDSSNYIIEEEDFISYLKNVKKHLKEDGVFIFDVNSYYKLSNILGNNIYTYNEDEVFYSWENVFEDDLLSMYLTFFVKKGELYERFEEEHLERAYTEEFIEKTLNDTGFKIIGKYDGYSTNKVNDKTERIVYIVKSNKVED
ncbi:class I SAM-dependent methyltransferase [Clostridium sartagoforme]|uniref:Class I SAM-dependent methyltransferase n=1 Tax=Clostridium sartagoforme TaxID=84031 RepID=A0A4S2DTN9_9CLOT|nr:class I SAM-dependent methyltransferase [Clostridium sartagoforme]TGY44411.1 class I SAM-dependent methyltransferase [Clostridium sartagoforme]